MRRQALIARPEPRTPGEPCGLCGGHCTEPLFRSPDYLSGESFDVLRCEGCGAAWTSFPHPEAEVGRYYGGTYYGPKGRRFTGLMEWAVAAFRRGRVRAIVRACPGGGRILDVGCGRGLILRELRRRGWSCFGTEISADLVKDLREEGVEAWEGPLAAWQLPERSFDAAILWHSLEHQFAPGLLLEEVARLMKPGGILFLEVPNLGSWQARLGRDCWFHLDVPRHLVHFTRESLISVVQRHGFVTERLSTGSAEQGPYGMIQSLLNRWIPTPNALYAALKRGEAQHAGRVAPGETRDRALTLALLPVAGVLGVGLEALSIVAGRGGVLRLTARRAPP